MSIPSKNTLEVGTILNDKWMILEFIAKGGMGEVYRAHQINLKRDVAIKIISQSWLKDIEDDEEIEIAFQRFQREVQTMAGIRHPNILQIYDYSTCIIIKNEEELPVQYIAMEYVPGNTLREIMSEQGFDPEENLTRDWVLNFFFPILDGVEAMHKLGMVHRDMKPENVLIDGIIPKITDFGLTTSRKYKVVTQSMDFKGTVMYMSPEQYFDLRRTDYLSDIYSLGKILFEAIVGKITSNEKIFHFKSVGIEKPETPFFKAMDSIIRKATAEERQERFESVEKFRNAIRNALAIQEQKTQDGSIPSIESVSTSDTLREPERQHKPKQHLWVRTGWIFALLALALMSLWHLLGNPGNRPSVHVDQPTTIIKKPAQTVNPPSSSMPTIVSKDGVILHYVSSGSLDIPGNTDLSVNVEPFYMDETPVTNQQYVEFLNSVIKKISVENEVILGSGNIWLMLGEVMKGYEPILYQNGIFSVKHPGHAACSVLRVTAFGASAYAGFYEKRLPTNTEWLYAYYKGRELQGISSETLPEYFKIPTPVLLFKANAFGISGLNQSISEWTIQAEKISGQKIVEGPNYIIVGKTENDLEDHDLYSGIRRMPWEAFKHVGFRCVSEISVSDKDKTKN